MGRFSDPEPLGKLHILKEFDSGESSLDIWLEKHARSAAGVGSARTFVVSDGEQERRVVGYHALTVATVGHLDAVGDATERMPRHPIPAVLIARLAVDRSVQARGIGAHLLGDAFVRAISVSETAGIRLVLVHALNDKASGFYKRFGFKESPTDPMNLQLLIKDARKSLNESAEERKGR